MSLNEDLAVVIRLACMTEDRDDAEQRALLRWAWTCDREHNRNTTSNRYRQRDDFELQDLVSLVQDSRIIEEDRRQHEVPMPNGWEQRWVLWEEGR